jgi:deoxycytidylate deaminase
MAKASPAKLVPVQQGREAKTIIEKIRERQTAELVIGFCGPLGSGTSAVAKEVSRILESYGYTVNTIRLSGLISKYIDKVKGELVQELKGTGIALQLPPEKMKEEDRITVLQIAGNLLRKIQSEDVLAQLTIKEISIQRHQKKVQEQAAEPTDIEPEARRYATVLDSLKNPEEVELLRAVYPNMFFLFGVLCPEDLRKRRLIQNKKIEPSRATALMDRDKAEAEKYGQQLLKTIFHADFFVRNTKENINSFTKNLERFIQITLGKAPVTPTKEESAMYYAQSAAVRSACLSRQVGAAIINEDGELIATGHNDVPRAGGGLYTAEDGDCDNRCMNLFGKVCQSDEFKTQLFQEIGEIIATAIKEPPELNRVLQAVKAHDRLKGLIEYCRAIHAEMDAITSAARRGGHTLKGAQMFCTTFPCHNCARHIIASGIKKVFYIEPYEKSLALRFHQDAIEFDPESETSTEKVVFLPFEGVAPRCYLSLFKARERKIDGKMVEIDLANSLPVIAQLMDRYVDFEAAVVKNLQDQGFGDEQHPPS